MFSVHLRSFCLCQGMFSAGGAATLASTLGVTGSSTLAALSAGATTLTSTLSVAGAASLSSSLTVAGAAQFTSGLASTSTNSGAAVVTGGFYLAFNLFSWRSFYIFISF